MKIVFPYLNTQSTLTLVRYSYFVLPGSGFLYFIVQRYPSLALLIILILLYQLKLTV